MGKIDSLSNKLYLSMTNEELLKEKEKLQSIYEKYLQKHLDLDISRGKPCEAQLDLSLPMLLDNINLKDFKSKDDIDCRNYGVLDGLDEIKQLFAEMLDVDKKNLFIGGNSSLSMMFDMMSLFMLKGVNSTSEPWTRQGKIKFLCICPGYDRHFSMLDYFGIEPVNVPMLNDGPDMEMIENLLSNDDSIKGMWCVPKYSNPTGIVYSDEVIRKIAKLKPMAKDFRIFWDNAYAVHFLEEKPDKILNILNECGKNNNEDMVIMFTSTSKITFPGAGISALACSENNLSYINEYYSNKTIGFNKINQLLHASFLKDYDSLLEHMKKHRDIIKPKFDVVVSVFNKYFKNNEIIKWTEPKGGYFISVSVLNGSAKRVGELCSKAGLKLTSIGATYPEKFDPNDENIRIAPTYPSIEELEEAMNLFCISIMIATVEKQMEKL